MAQKDEHEHNKEHGREQEHHEHEQEEEKHEHRQKHEQEQHAKEKMVTVNKLVISSSSMSIVQIKYLPAVGMLLENY
jgi:Skp family chaperone for outer membrane proteins